MISNSVSDDERWMRAALLEAKQAFSERETPVGAVVVHQGKIIGRGYNQVERLQDPTAHAEILAIGAAANAMGSWRLEGATLYVTLEPCAMCAGAIVLSRLSRLVFGAPDPKTGACGSLFDIVQDTRLNHQVEVASGIMEAECGGLLRDFFKTLRETKELGDR
ncbi:MAG: tRNA adenosine(34) deaminase TadA [Candidatus Latescibacterota bacterium]